jgi:undecaprenyl pyrophosphate phosphatase UppP
LGPLDALNHLLNLLLVPLALGAVAAALAKLLWRRELAAVAWRRLALPACAACALVVVAGLIVFGRDGKMATYAAMVVACAITLWWRGFGPGR